MANHGDKRSVSTDALETLGTIISEGQGRDAIHLAVEPVEAGEDLRPGQHVGLMNRKAHAATGGARDVMVKKLGIVDPFLAVGPKKGERFWLVVYPRQITSLRHVWSHPDFPDATTPTISLRAKQGHKVMKEVARNLGVSINTLMATVGWYVDDRTGNGPYSRNGEICFGEDINHCDLPDNFWESYEAASGRKVPAEYRENAYFRCAC